MRWSIIILMSLSFACSKKEASAPAEPDQAAETETATSAEGPEPADPAAEAAEDLPEELKGETPALGAPPVINVLEQGQEPRQALRWNVKPGLKQEVSLEIASGVEAIIALARVLSPTYTVSLDLALEATKVEADGTARVTFSIGRATVESLATGDEERTKRLEAGARQTRNAGGAYSLGSHGRVTDLTLSVPEKAKPTTREMIENLRWSLVRMVPTLPEEPVGKGATWTVHEAIEQGDVRVNQFTTFKIEEIDGPLVSLSFRSDQSAEPQSFRTPGTVESLELAVWAGAAEGSLTWNLTELAPRAAKVDASAQKHAVKKTEDPAKQVTVTLKADHTLEVVPEKK